MAPPKKNHQNTNGGSEERDDGRHVCRREMNNGTVCNRVVANNPHSISSHNHNFHSGNSRYEELQATRENRLVCREADCSHQTRNFNAMLGHMRRAHGFRGSSNPLKRHYNLPISTRRTSRNAAARQGTQSGTQGSHDDAAPVQLPPARTPARTNPTGAPQPLQHDEQQTRAPRFGALPFGSLSPQEVPPFTAQRQTPEGYEFIVRMPQGDVSVVHPYPSLQMSEFLEYLSARRTSPVFPEPRLPGYSPMVNPPPVFPVPGFSEEYAPIANPSPSLQLPSFAGVQPETPLPADEQEEEDDDDDLGQEQEQEQEQCEGSEVDSDADAPGEPDYDYIDPRLGRFDKDHGSGGGGVSSLGGQMLSSPSHCCRQSEA